MRRYRLRRGISFLFLLLIEIHLSMAWVWALVPMSRQKKRHDK